MIRNEIIFKNIGNIENENILLKPFTIIVGKNNTGKTLLANALFFLHSKYMKQLIKDLIKETINEVEGKSPFVKAKNLLEVVFKKFNEYPIYNKIYKNEKFNDSHISFDYKIFDNIEKEFDLHEAITKFFEDNPMILKLLEDAAQLKSKKIPTLIHTDNLYERNKNLIEFLNAIFQNDTDIPIIIAENILNNHFCTNKEAYIFPVERAGINTFFFDVTREINASNVSLENYLNLLHDLKSIYNGNKSDYYDIACHLENELFTGKIELKENPLSNSKKVTFTDINDVEVDSAFFSSSINELSTLILYLKHKAKKGDLVLIDEPELSLHPDAQRILIKYLSILNNEGIKFILITHSDYIIKEISHTISLGIKKEKFTCEEDFIKAIYHNKLDEYFATINDKKYFAGLKNESILYSLNQNTKTMKTVLEKLNPNLLGFDEKIFNNVINNTNSISNRIASFVLEDDIEDDIFSNL